MVEAIEQTTTSRRRFLAGIGAGAAAGLTIPLPAMASSDLALMKPQFDAALAAYESASDEAEGAGRLYADRKPMRPTEAYVPNGFMFSARWSEERQPDGRYRTVGTIAQWESVAAKYRKRNWHELADKAQARADAVRRWESDLKRLRDEIGLDAAEEASITAYEALCAIEDEILTTPATSLSDLAVKVAVVRRQDASNWTDDDYNATIALINDIERLAPAS
ncbi:MAG: hypothetical protein K0S00_4683 [Xanthobacteraceae bacterium]|jgi:hypothetical protein|nr:hypothetical protein [Xanthobacteraceae bacterium]